MPSGFSKLYGVIRNHLGLNITAIDNRLFRKLFVKGASVRRYDGTCCLTGTTVTVKERDRILAHAELVKGSMTSRARRDPSLWFDKRTKRDPDFTAGRTANTRVKDGACVFYRDDGLCALQVAGEKGLKSPFALKPAVCLLWPLCVQDRKLHIGYAWFTRRRECCAPVRSGSLTILQVMVPDEKLIREMGRPGYSRGGGPPRQEST